MNNVFVLLFLTSLVCLVVGLFKPAVFSKYIKGELTRKRTGKIFGISSVVLFILVGVTAPPNKNDQIAPQSSGENTIQGQVVGKDISTSTTSNSEILSAPETTKTPTSTSAPKTIQVKKTESEIAAPRSVETVSQINAVKKAKSYLSYTAFSHDGLVAQLEYEKFSHEDAVYGADNSGANWNEQAVKKAKAYLEYTAFSREGLIDQLIYDKFTRLQAEYGVSSVGL